MSASWFLNHQGSYTGFFNVFQRRNHVMIFSHSWLMFLTDSFFTVKSVGWHEIKTIIPVSCSLCLEH